MGGNTSTVLVPSSNGWTSAEEANGEPRRHEVLVKSYSLSHHLWFCAPNWARRSLPKYSSPTQSHPPTLTLIPPTLLHSVLAFFSLYSSLCFLPQPSPTTPYLYHDRATLSLRTLRHRLIFYPASFAPSAIRTPTRPRLCLHPDMATRQPLL